MFPHLYLQLHCRLHPLRIHSRCASLANSHGRMRRPAAMSLPLLLGAVLPQGSLGFVVPPSPLASPPLSPPRSHLHSGRRAAAGRILLPFGGPFVGWKDDDGTRIALSMITFASASADFADPLLYQHMATGGALAFAGDVIAQTLLSKAEGKNSIPPRDWDVVRTWAFVAFGALYTGGAQHFIFAFLNASFDEPLMRLALAQFFFIPFCYYPTFLFMVPALRAGWEESARDDGRGVLGFSLDSEQARTRRDELFADVAGRIPATLARNWCFWLPVQFVQFNFVPPDLQVTYAAAFGVVWNAILSWSTAAAGPAAKKDV